MAPIRDPNLRLILLEAAWNEDLLPRFDKDAFYRDALKEKYDPRAEYNQRIDERVRDALLSAPLDDDVLSQLKIVTWDGGNEAFLDIWTYWDGESGEFDVVDLAGIEKCTSLERLLFLAGARFPDCVPLGGLTQLHEVRIRGEEPASLGALLSLPKLKKVGVAPLEKPVNTRVIDQLRARGVEILPF
jgi:hypothetical protein